MKKKVYFSKNKNHLANKHFKNRYSDSNLTTTSEVANKMQLETIRQEKLDFIVITFSGKFDRQIIIDLQRNKRGEEFIQIIQVCV